MALNIKYATLLAAMALAAMAGTTGHAKAFTIENQGASDNGGSANFADPDDKLLQNFGGGGSPPGQSGPSLQFGTPLTTNGGQGASVSAPVRFDSRSVAAITTETQHS